MNADLAWQSAQGQLQLEMPKAAYDTWVRDAEMVSYEDGTFIIGVHNAYARDWLESRLSSTVVRLLAGIMNRSTEVRFIVWHRLESSDPLPEPEPVNPVFEEEPTAAAPKLNPRYTFENFVVGASNRLAHAAAWPSWRIQHRLTTLCSCMEGRSGKDAPATPSAITATSEGLNILYVSSKSLPTILISSI
jgi:chromosomal replication initiator protein